MVAKMMVKRVWTGAVFSLALLSAAWLGGSTTGTAMAQATTPNGVYMWNYSVKFVCGRQQPIDPADTTALGEPPVKPGNYATEINIHNYSYREFKLRKKLLVLVEKGEVVGREPDVVRPDPNRFASVVLTPDSATLDDCNALWKMAGGVPPAANAPLTIGYLVLLSPMDLDVDAVYTAEVGQKVAGAATEQPTGISIDVQRVPGKRVLVPTAFLSQFP